MIRPGRPAHPEMLTPREQEVLALLREGLTNPQIAERLSITLDGAKYHVSEILSKLGVSSREEAAQWDPSERPWWATAIAPLGWAWRKANVSWLGTALAGVTAVLVVAGVSLLVWGLVRTDGGADAGDDASLQVAPTAQIEPTPAVSSPTVSPATPAPTTEPTAAQPTSTSEPILLAPASTQLLSATPDPACATRDYNHLNIDKLGAHPNMTDAVITEIDNDTIRILFEGVEVIVEGSGELLTFSGKLTREQQTRVVTAIDAVLYEC